VGLSAPPMPHDTYYGYPLTPAATLADLTRRQREVAVAVAEGLSNKEVAALLSISDQTVKNNLTILYIRTGTGGRVALARWVWEQERGRAEG
jgi:DNA-binding NarL/FixJ family response regulator